jgi:peptide/nickel transport system substrate-binding protein
MGMRTALSLAGALVVGLAATAVAQQHPPPAPPKAGAPDAQRTTSFQQAGSVQQAALAQQAPAAQYKLNIAVGGAFTSMDPHYHNLGPNNALTSYVFEPLIRFDPKFQPQPALAVSWRAIDEKTWELKLREGVTFHDGTPFTADDVVFTFARIPALLNSPSSFIFAVKPIVQTEIVDPHTIRLHTAGPVPLIPYILTSVAIVSKRHAEGMTTASFNSLQSAIGTGPYRVTAFTVGDQATFQRNDSWWDKQPHWNTVSYRLVTDEAARIATLRAGDADVIDAVPTRDVGSLRGNPNITITAQPGQRLIYLAPDASRMTTPFATEPSGRPMEMNPLRDPRVRRALSLAINREGLKDHIMDGFAAPTGQLMPAGLSGYEPAITVDPYDPEHAKKMLAEAGYPLGFGLTLHGPNNRYVNDAKLVEAIAQMWTRIGVKTQVEVMPAATFFSRSLRGEFSIRLTGWASDTGEASSDLTELVASSNPDKGRGAVFMPDKYANPKVDTIVEQALATIDVEKRESLYREAERLAMPDMPIIPLHHQVNIWAVRKGLTFHVRMQERTNAWDIEPQ